jgi:uncharacterized protein DUF2442
MKSKKPGTRTSPRPVEVLSVSPHGVWLSVLGREFLLAFDRYPWFRDATIAQIQRVELRHGKHLRWPGLDVDLELDSLARPEHYPLVYRG